MSKDNVSFDGFEAFTGIISGRGSSSGAGDYEIVDPSAITGKPEDTVDDDTDNDDFDKDIDQISKQTTDVNISDDDDIDDEPVKTKVAKTKTEVKTDDVSDLGEYEEDVAEMVQEKLFQEFGWEVDDKKFKSVKEIVDFVKEVIDENSTPDYANEELIELDKFVKNGGDIKNYLTQAYGGVDVDTVDLENPNDCKAVIREQMLIKGVSEAVIKKRLDRYEDTGILKEEAEESVDIIKEYKTIQKQKLLEEQQKIATNSKRQQQEYIMSVEEAINSMDNVRGVPVNKTEKKQLMDYIFKPTADGMTQYQKDYAKNSRNLIESAYFTMKGDAYVQKIQSQATSTATKKLRDRLAEKGKRATDQGDQGNGSVGSFGLLSSMLRKPTQ